MNDTFQSDRSPWAIFLIFLRLGLTSFGGPVAHLGYFREEFVVRRQWLTEASYADVVALCQFLPGPASSQVGMALGLLRSGCTGALAAWVGFTLPSALALIGVAQGMTHYGEVVPLGALHGLKVVAVAVVAQAVWGMARPVCTDVLRATILVAAACGALWMPSAWGQMGVLAVAAAMGWCGLGSSPAAAPAALPQRLTRRAGGCLWGLFLVLLMGLPGLAAQWAHPIVSMVDAFYRAGSLVFGGGHVVLPWLQAEVVSTGWVSPDVFLAGYGAAQAVPGPLFTFAAFLGASMHPAFWGVGGGLIGLVAIFAPSFLLVLGTWPFWERLRHHARVQAALSGVHAGVVGLLLASLYQPVATSAIRGPQDVGLVLVALLALLSWKLPPWLVVLGSAAVGGVWHAVG